MPNKLILVAGARPNFMKVAPLLRLLLQHSDFLPLLVHTGQHYDETMSGQFFRDLEIPAPAYNLEVGSGSHAQQTAEIMKRFEPVLVAEEPRSVVVFGDVNSTLACALTASKLLVPVIHVEAGLRSFDRSMPEEINRVVTDAISNLLLVSEESGRRNLEREGVPSGKIVFVGNLMIDSLRTHVEQARKSDILDRLGIGQQRYGLITLHRGANVDDAGQLGGIMSALAEISREIPLWFPVHPRTRKLLEKAAQGLPPTIRLTDPLSYPDFLCAMSRSAVVFTDSGGIQEETTVLGVPCLTLRNNTERPVTIEQGTNHLAGTSRESILGAWNRARLQGQERIAIPPLWDGNAALRAMEAIRAFLANVAVARAL